MIKITNESNNQFQWDGNSYFSKNNKFYKCKTGQKDSDAEVISADEFGKAAKKYKDVFESQSLEEDMATKIADYYDDNPSTSDDIDTFLDAHGANPNDNVDVAIRKLSKKDQIELYNSVFDDDTEDDYVPKDDQVEQIIMEALTESDKIDNVSTFSEAGIMTRNRGFIVTINGHDYQLQLNGIYYNESVGKTEASKPVFIPDTPDDNHKPWGYKGFRVRWNKEEGIWKIYNRDGDYEWDGESRQICKDFIDSY